MTLIDSSKVKSVFLRNDITDTINMEFNYKNIDVALGLDDLLKTTIFLSNDVPIFLRKNHNLSWTLMC